MPEPFGQPDAMLNAATAAAIVRANFVKRHAWANAKRANTAIAGYTQKAVALAVWLTEGMAVTNRQLGELAGLSDTTAHRALTVLIREGIVRRVTALTTNAASVYRLDLAKLAEMATPITPLSDSTRRRTARAAARQLASLAEDGEQDDLATTNHQETAR